jgi:excisionase family DNA binding protein
MNKAQLRLPAATPRETPDLMTSQQVANRLAISIRTLWRLVRANRMPQPVRYNRKLVRWKAAELARYIKNLPTAQEGC